MLNLDFTGTDQISGLWVDGLHLPPGIYSSTSGFITGTGTLTVTTGLPSTDYATWSGRGLHDLTGGPADDDDNDGIANLLEYVLGGDPRPPPAESSPPPPLHPETSSSPSAASTPPPPTPPRSSNTARI